MATVKNGKLYNEMQCGSFIVCVPVYGHEGRQAFAGKLKDVFTQLLKLSEEAKEENRRLYLQHRDSYEKNRKRMQELEGEFRLLGNPEDIQTIERKRSLVAEYEELIRRTQDDKVLMTQLFESEFVPKSESTPSADPPEPEPPLIPSERYKRRGRPRLTKAQGPSM